MVRFGLADLEEQIADFASAWPGAVADRHGITFVGAAVARLRLPLAAPRASPGERIGDYAQKLPGPVERQVVLLLRAAGVAMGYWDGDVLVHHKALRKYVVRGHGKAQQTHRKTRGKSRYGSRLRLQNWRRLLVETNERLIDYWRQYGEPERVFFAVPVRAFAELLAMAPVPPFARDDAKLQRLPMHVHRPDFDELQRVRGWLCHGRLELPQ